MEKKRPSENAARKAVEAWLDQNAPGYPDYSLIQDGDDGWAFYIADQDTTSYLHHDMKIEWYGTGWPDRYAYDEGSGCWSATPIAQPNVDGDRRLLQWDIRQDRNAYPEGPLAKDKAVYAFTGWEGCHRGNLLLTEAEANFIRGRMTEATPAPLLMPDA